MNNHHNHHRFLNNKTFKENSNRLKIALAIVVVIMLAEIAGGLLSDSLALLSDAGHMLVDALALGLSLFALTIARRPATVTKTYGYHRVEIMAALVNGVTLILVAAFIFYEAYQRFLTPPPIRTPIMLGVAVIGLIANVVGIRLLRGGSLSSLNLKAAFWHVVGDTISSVGVIVGAIIIYFTGLFTVDPVIAIIIGVIILWGAVQLVRESVDILLEAVPRNIQIDKVVETIKRVSGIEEVHDIHIWTITSGIIALSAHLRITDQMVSKSAEILEKVNQDLGKYYSIAHTTLQLECETCPTNSVCQVCAPEEDLQEDSD